MTRRAAEFADPPVGQEHRPDEPETEREARGRERALRRAERPAATPHGRMRWRTKLDRGSRRALAMAGIIAIAVVLGAVLTGQDVAGWIVGLVIGLTSVILTARFWPTREH